MKLEPAESEVIAAEAGHYAERVQSPSGRETYERLRSAASTGQLPEDLATVVGQVVELGLQTGRIRGVYGPHGVLTAIGVFRRTPQGQDLSKKVESVNEALEALRGQVVERVTVSAPSPGAATLTLETGEARMAMSFDPEGPSVRTLEVSL